MMLVLLGLFTALTTSNEFRLGADYSNQTYGVVNLDTLRYPEEKDTTDFETEGRASWDFGLDLESGPTGFRADNDLNLSTRSVRDALRLDFETELAPGLTLDAADAAEARFYHKALPQLADTGYSKNHLSNSTDLKLNYAVSEAVSVFVSNQVQFYHYPEPDSYNYDYLLNRARAGTRVDLGDISGLDLGYGWSRRWAGDQRYWEHSVEAGLDWYFDAGPHAELTADGIRRVYPEKYRTYWEFDPALRLDVDLGGKVSLSLDDESRFNWYDSTGSVYTNMFENSLRPVVEYRPVSELSLRLGPQFETGRSLPAPTEDDFREISILAGFDLMKADRLWLSVEDRVGVRRYPLADSSFQSDYLFNELTAFASWTIVKAGPARFSLDAMVSISPEWHSDAASNLASRIYSVELKYGR